MRFRDIFGPYVEEAAITTDNWPQEDHLMASVETKKAANGASSAVSMEERSAAQDPETPRSPFYKSSK